MLPPFQDIHGLLVDFVANAVGIRSGRSNEEVQRLHPGIPGALGHYVEQFPVWLGMELIKHHPVDIKSMLGIGFCRQNLVETVGGPEHHPFLGGQDLDPFGKGRTHPDHVRCHFKDNGSLLPVCRTAIDFCPFFPVTTAKQEGHRSSQFTVMGRYKRPPCKVAMTPAVHLDALHGNFFLHRLDAVQIMEKGACLFHTFPFSTAFSFQL